MITKGVMKETVEMAGCPILSLVIKEGDTQVMIGVINPLKMSIEASTLRIKPQHLDVIFHFRVIMKKCMKKDILMIHENGNPHLTNSHFKQANLNKKIVMIICSIELMANLQEVHQVDRQVLH